jgi:ATP-dependent Clp protease adapter protein ClpS
MTDEAADMFHVRLLNDDVTPMEFVVYVLEQIFDKDRETATRIMLDAHHRGSCVCGIYSLAVAEAKAKALRDLAGEHQHPLNCLVEAAKSG